MKRSEPQALYSLVGILKDQIPKSLDELELHGCKPVSKGPLKIVMGLDEFLVYQDKGTDSYYVFKMTGTGY